jgi:hypothetical protein
MLENVTLAIKTGSADLETEAFIEAYLRPPVEYRAYIAERLATFTGD